MLTIFACPKPFRGLFETIQLNALLSWAHLRPRPEVILLGDAPGTAEASRGVGAMHLPEVPRNEYGTPLMNGLFALASRAAGNRTLCYANSDVMFTDWLMHAAQAVSARFETYLMTGRRANLLVEDLWDFDVGNWQGRLESEARRNGRLDSWIAADYFVFPRGSFATLPPFAVGRTAWDNWLLYFARASRIPVVDATRFVLAVHQRHDYSHHPEDEAGLWTGPEAQRNLELAGGPRHAFSIADATHVLSAMGDPRPALHPVYVWRHLYVWPVLRPSARLLRPILDALLTITKPLRHRFGWTLGRR